VKSSTTSQFLRLTRRELLLHAVKGAGVAGVGILGGPTLLFAACSRSGQSVGTLLQKDANGLRLPPGFTSRVVAVTGEIVAGTNYVWHSAPDGGATFATDDGGWIYVSNAEVNFGGGGVSALRFASNGSIVAAYSILSGTDRNCAGGPTPWNTWLSCEEVRFGEVYECDPFVPGSQGVVRPALGVFNHEAVAVDPIGKQLYLTEDERDGLLYRFTPTQYPSLSSGVLEAAEILDPSALGEIAPDQTRGLAWHLVPDPSASTGATRHQVPHATVFNGGEGCAYRDGIVFLATKGDDRVWRLDTRSDQIQILYDRATSQTPILSGVDNVLPTPGGDVYVAEDPGDLQIVALRRSGEVEPIVQVTGQMGSEVTGPALSPDGTRLYFSSQRLPGTTYEVTGPF
jgi:hypothetical protein